MTTVVATVIPAMMTIMTAVIAMLAELRPVRMTIYIRTTVDVIHPTWPIVDRVGGHISRRIDHHGTDMRGANRMYINRWRRSHNYRIDGQLGWRDQHLRR